MRLFPPKFGGDFLKKMKRRKMFNMSYVYRYKKKYFMKEMENILKHIQRILYDVYKTGGGMNLFLPKIKSPF